jgi:hypothetical protein
VRGVEYVVGSGYRFKNVKFPFAIGGVAPKSDLNLRVDLSLRQNNTVIRKMQEHQNQVTAGQNIISIKTSRTTCRTSAERPCVLRAVINKPVISTSFPSAKHQRGHLPAVHAHAVIGASRDGRFSFPSLHNFPAAMNIPDGAALYQGARDGSASRAMRPWWASRTTRRASWATWCSWTSPPWARRWRAMRYSDRGCGEDRQRLFMPVTATVLEANAELANNAALVNQDPYGPAGWCASASRTRANRRAAHAEQYKALVG